MSSENHSWLLERSHPVLVVQIGEASLFLVHNLIGLMVSYPALCDLLCMSIHFGIRAIFRRGSVQSSVWPGHMESFRTQGYLVHPHIENPSPYIQQLHRSDLPLSYCAS